MTFSFTVPGTPKGQPRAKHRAFRVGNQIRSTTYDPGTADAYKSAIRDAAMKAKPEGWEPHLPYRVDVCVRIPRPKYHFKCGDPARGIKPAYTHAFPTVKPDIDNVIKAVYDAITHAGVWNDDAQVVSEYVEKQYASGMNSGFTTVEITSLR